MTPTGPGPQLQCGRPTVTTEHPKRDARLLGLGRSARDDPDDIGTFVFPEQVRPLAGLLRAMALDNGPVNFLDRPLAELGREPARRLARPGQEHHARGGSVE